MPQRIKAEAERAHHVLVNMTGQPIERVFDAENKRQTPYVYPGPKVREKR